MKRLACMAIFLHLLAKPTTAQELNTIYEIDVVCQEAQRNYRVNGEKGSTWKWMLTNAEGIPVTLLNSICKDLFTPKADGDTLWGSEFIIKWAVDTGIYYLSVEQTGILGCSSEQLGFVRVIQGPDGYAGTAGKYMVPVTGETKREPSDTLVSRADSTLTDIIGSTDMGIDINLSFVLDAEPAADMKVNGWRDNFFNGFELFDFDHGIAMLKEQKKKFIESITTNGNNLITSVNNTMNISKIEAGNNLPTGDLNKYKDDH